MSGSVGKRHGVESRLERLGAPVDIASLVLFRICFGLVLHWEIWRFFLKGRIRSLYIDPTFHFKYLGFGWVEPLPGDGMYLVFAVLGICSVGIVFGLFYRASCLLFGVVFLYVFLIDEMLYLNHHYLVILLCFLMALIPAHRSLSIDAWRKPSLHSETAPTWAIWLLRTQIGIVYFYAGLAKLKYDWLHGRPTLDMWAFGTLEHDWMRWLDPGIMAYFLSYGGLMLDLFVVPLLLWRRTRGFAFAGTVFFHVSNKLLFQIGIFPYMMTAATTLFFEPDWPRRLLARFRPQVRRGGKVEENPSTSSESGSGRLQRPEPVRRGWVILIGLYLFLQFTIPLRHYAYPGSVIWTEEGQYFAWHMLLRAKNVRSAFRVTDPANGQEQVIDPRRFLPKEHGRRFAHRPDMVVQFAHYLKEELEALGYDGFQIYGDVYVSLNGRKPQRLIDPSVDLTSVRRSLRPRSYILPLTEPLPPMAESVALIKESLDPGSVD